MLSTQLVQSANRFLTNIQIGRCIIVAQIYVCKKNFFLPPNVIIEHVPPLFKNEMLLLNLHDELKRKLEYKGTS